MEPTPGPFRIEVLLAHRDWVTRTARALAHGDAEAGDLEQDAWLGILERPPRTSPRSPKAWLGSVLRFKAADRARSEGARHRRETAVARPERVAQDPADVVSQAEIAERVARMVLKLEEPFRTAVLLRYFEGLAPDDVATRMGVPVETVRSRLGRGLSRLREKLDGECDGDRRAWCLALLPLAGDPGPGRGATPVVGAVASAVAGGILMGAKTWAVTAAAVLIIGGAAWFLSSRDDGAPVAAGTGRAPPKEVASSPTPRKDKPPAPASVPVPGAATTAQPPAPAPRRKAPEEEAQPFPPAIRGHVLFAPGEVATGIAEARCVPLAPDVEATKEYLQRRGEASELQPEFGNRFVFARLKPGRYGVGVSRARSGPICAFKAVEVGGGIVDLDIEVAPLRRHEYLVARVLDPDGKPLRDARLTVTYHAQLPGSPVGAGYASGVGGSTILREDGTLWVPLEPALPEGARNLQLEAESPTYGVRTAPVTGGDAPEADIQFMKEGKLQVHLEGYSTCAYQGRVRLWLSPASAQGGLGAVQSGPNGNLDAEGNMSFQVQPGEYDLEVALLHVKQFGQRSKTGKPIDHRDSNVPAFQTHRVRTTRVTVPAGESAVSVEMPRLHALTIRGGSGMVVVRLRGQGNWPDLVADTSEDGTCTVDGLPEGEYWIISGENGERRAKALVPAVTGVQLEVVRR